MTKISILLLWRHSTQPRLHSVPEAVERNKFVPSSSRLVLELVPGTAAAAARLSSWSMPRRGASSRPASLPCLRQPKRLGECRLGHAELCATQAQLRAHMCVNWMCYIFWRRLLVTFAEGHTGASETEVPFAPTKAALQFSELSRLPMAPTLPFDWQGPRHVPLATQGYTTLTLPCRGTWAARPALRATDVGRWLGRLGGSDAAAESRSYPAPKMS
jgi:hypothetical protein